MSFDTFYNILTQEKLEICFVYQDKTYWIIVNDKYRFLNEDMESVQLFESVSDLVKAPLFDEKRLQEVWDYIKILSFDYGWKKNVNIITL